MSLAAICGRLCDGNEGDLCRCDGRCGGAQAGFGSYFAWWEVGSKVGGSQVCASVRRLKSACEWQRLFARGFVVGLRSVTGRGERYAVEAGVGECQLCFLEQNAEKSDLGERSSASKFQVAAKRSAWGGKRELHGERRVSVDL